MPYRAQSVENEQKLTLEMAHEYWDCDPDNGVLRWKVRPNMHPRIAGRIGGKIAGTKNSPDGYIRVNITLDEKKISFPAHRIIWFIEIPRWKPRRLRRGGKRD